jgi:hypothetical protein
MQFNTLKSYGFGIWRHFYALKAPPKAPMCVLGKPGIGKSACARGIAGEIGTFLNRPVVDLTEEPQFSRPIDSAVLFYAADLSSFLPEDIGGIPKTLEDDVCGTEMLVASYAVQRWLAPFCVPGAVGVLCLDDLPAAAPSVMVAARQLVLDRRIGQMRLSDGVILFVTGNRREDKSSAKSLPAHFRNTNQLLEIDTNVETWCEWYGEQPDHAPVVAAFLRFRPSHHSKTPKDASKLGAFATPRSWALLGACYTVAQAEGVLLDVASGLVGEGVATEFQAFINVRNQLVDPMKVLLDPLKMLPDPKRILNSPDKAYAMCTGLGEVAAEWRKGADAKKKKEVPLLFMRAVGHCTQRDREFIATAVVTYTSNGGDIASLVQAARTNKGDQLVKSVIDFLANTFNKTGKS